jgi:hypothetical protein
VVGRRHDNDAWLDRLPWGCAWFVALPLVVVVLVAASVLGNRINDELPHGFGLVGMLVTACIMALVLGLLLAPARTKRHLHIRFRRRRRRRHDA